MSASKSEKARQLDVAATWGERPIEELNALIQRRIGEMGQCAKTAVIGTAIAVCRSLRGQTAVAKMAKLAPFDVEPTALYGSWTRDKGAKARRCFRRGPTKDAQKCVLENGKYRQGRMLYSICWMVDNKTPQKDCKVWLVRTKVDRSDFSFDTDDAFMVVSKNKGACRLAYKARKQKRIGRYRYLARNALTVAMKQLASSAPTLQGSQRAQRVAGLVANARTYGASGSFVAEVHDNLRYAALAVQGGEAGINLAFVKTANKIAGNIINTYHRQGKFLEPAVRVPFPEIVARGA